MDQVQAVIACGGDDPAKNTVAGPNVTVLPFMDQWNALAQASVFITHHGLNSTHEAIWHQVPMISMPFFHDPPGLARLAEARKWKAAVIRQRPAVIGRILELAATHAS